MRRLAVALAVAVMLSSCSKEAQLIGSYIDTDYSDGALMVQIDSVDHRDVRGTITIASFDQNGVAHPRRVPISGTVEGKALNLSVENGTGLDMLNGTIVPDGLDLTMMGNGGSARFLFKRKDAAEFNRVVASLRTSSAETQQQTQAAAFSAQRAARGPQEQSQIDDQTDRLLSDAETITAKTRQFDNAVEYYQHISARNTELRSIEARYGPADATGRVADVESRVDGNRNLASNAHVQAQAFWQNVQSESDANLHRASDLMANCQSDPRLSCNRLTKAVAEYDESVSELHAAFDRESAAYDTQRVRF